MINIHSIRKYTDFGMSEQCATSLQMARINGTAKSFDIKLTVETFICVFKNLQNLCLNVPFLDIGSKRLLNAKRPLNNHSCSTVGSVVLFFRFCLGLAFGVIRNDFKAYPEFPTRYPRFRLCNTSNNWLSRKIKLSWTDPGHLQTKSINLICFQRTCWVLDKAQIL